MRSETLPTPDTVLIYRSLYGQLSETFVRDHVHGLRRFRPLVLTNRIDRRSPAETAETVVVPNASRVRRLFWRKGWSRAANALLQERRPALIHAHFLFDGASILPYARKHGIPLIVTAHGYDATLYPDAMAQTDEGRLLLARWQDLADYATRIVCVSDFLRDELAKRGWPEHKLTTLHLGVDSDTILPNYNADRKGILTVGRLVEKKGTEYLLEAYSELPKLLQQAHQLTVIGDGPLRAKLEDRAAKLDIDVRFLGSRSRDQIFAAMKENAVFCLPSVRAASGDSEGMPIVIMEALAIGIPTVVFEDQPGAALKKHGAVLTAPSRDARSLAESLQQAISDAPLRERLATSGRSLCEALFDIKKNIRSLEDLYQEAT